MRNLKKFESAILKGCQGTRKIKNAIFRFRKDGSVSGACIVGALHLGLGNKEVVEAFRRGDFGACCYYNRNVFERFGMYSESWQIVDLNNLTALSREEIARKVASGKLDSSLKKAGCCRL